MSEKEDAPGAGAGISDEAKKEIDELKGRLAASDARATAAEQEAAKARNSVAHAEKATEDAELQMVSTAIETAVTTRDALKARYKEALSTQDYDAAADINVEISEVSAKLLTLNNGKAAMEEERKRPRQPQRQEVDVVEAVARDLAQWPRSQAWVRSHPDYVRDPKKNALMQSAHFAAVAEGIPHDTDAYFEFVEKRLGLRKAEGSESAGAAGDGDGGAESAAAKGRERQGGDKAPPAAPPGGGGGSGNGRRLTPMQKEMARASGVTEEEYAKNLEALTAEGRIGKVH